MQTKLAESQVPFLNLNAISLSIQDELEAASQRVIRSGRYILGPELEAFEAEFAQYVGTDWCVGVGSGLDALTLLLRALDVDKACRVALPAHTFIATWLAAHNVGAQTVLLDVSEETMLLDPVELEAELDRGLDAVLTVHLYGSAQALPATRRLATSSGIPLVEDAAQAHGATVGGKRVGADSSLAAWSFYPGKNLGALGDGGAITTSDSALAHHLKSLRNYGSTTKYNHELAGFNSRLDELQAAVLRVKLRHLDEWNERRSQQAEFYLRNLPRHEQLILPNSDSERYASAWHLFVLRTPDRDGLQQHLAARGIETLIHYPVALPDQPAVRQAMPDSSPTPAVPVSRRIAASCLSLPIGPHLRSDDLDRVVQACSDYFDHL